MSDKTTVGIDVSKFALDVWIDTSERLIHLENSASGIAQLLNEFEGLHISGVNGNTTHDDGTRGTPGGLWSEWGNLLTYDSAGFSGYIHWSSEQKSSGNHYVVTLVTGVVSSLNDSITTSVVCRQGL